MFTDPSKFEAVELRAMSKCIVFSAKNGEQGWQSVSFAQNISDDATQFGPPSPDLLDMFNSSDLILLLQRASISLPSKVRKSELVEHIIENWQHIVLAQPASSELLKVRSRTEVLKEAFSLNITHLEVLDKKTNKIRTRPLEKCSVAQIEKAISAKKEGMVFSLLDDDTPSVLDEMEPPPTLELPVLNVKGLQMIKQLDEELSPRTFFTPRFHEDPKHQMPPPNPLDYGTDNFFANVIQHWWRSKREVAKDITVDGEPYSITLSSTVKELKQMVRIKKKTVLSDVRLTFGGQALQEDRTLRSCLVTERSNLHLEKKIQIFVRNLEGTTLRFLMFASDSGFDLMNKIEALEGIPQQHQRIIFAGHHVEGYHLLSDHHVKDEDTLHLVMRLPGGARGVIKTQFIKSDASLKKLQDRSKQIIQDALMKEKIDMNPLRDIPEELKPLINGVQERIKDLMDKARSGPVIKENLQKLSDDQLSLLSNLMSKKGGTEEKLSQIAHIVNPDVKLITTAIPLLNTLRMELMESFIKLYSEEFHAEWKTEMVYNNEAFKTAVEDIITYRANIRRFAQIEGAVPPPTIHPPPQDTSSCVVA